MIVEATIGYCWPVSSIPPDSNDSTADTDGRGDHSASSGLSLDQVLETDLPYVFGRYELQTLVGQGGIRGWIRGR